MAPLPPISSLTTHLSHLILGPERVVVVPAAPAAVVVVAVSIGGAAN